VIGAEILAAQVNRKPNWHDGLAVPPDRRRLPSCFPHSHERGGLAMMSSHMRTSSFALLAYPSVAIWNPSPGHRAASFRERTPSVRDLLESDRS
jgi:hypothetical protein